jgi:hypothetical protein
MDNFGSLIEKKSHWNVSQSEFTIQKQKVSIVCEEKEAEK